MSQDTPNSRETRLEQVLAEYLRALEKGNAPDEAMFLKKHPDLANDLRSFFANRAAVAHIAAPLRNTDQEPTLGLTSSGTEANGNRVRYFGDYELLDELGRGGMGVVYKARQTTLNRPVALKMILAGQLASADDVLRFKQEAEAAANLDHPHIAPIYETGDHHGQHYFSMKLIEGRSLREALPTLRQDVRASARMLALVARGVHHAHQRGVLHRDLKPANILLDVDGSPYVTDFGLAKRVSGGSDVTRTGAIVGTPSYMAPEQATGEKQLTTAVDIYSLGAILYELLAGQPPFRGDSPMETLLAVMSKEPARPSTLQPGVDPDLETIALKCLEKDPQRRYDSAAALADDLERWLRGEPIAARPAGNVERTWRWCRRNPLVAGLIGAVAASLVAGIVVSTWLAREARYQTQQAQQAAGQANMQRINAETAQKKAEQNELAALENNYRSTVIQAQHHLNLGETGMLVQALESQLPENARGRDFRRFEWHLLNRIAHGYERSLPGYPASVYHIRYSPDGKYLVTAGLEFVRVYDALQGRVLFDLLPGGALDKDFGIEQFCFTPDARFLALIDGGQASRMVRRDEFQPLGIRVFSLPDGKAVHSFEGSERNVFSADGQQFATLKPPLAKPEPKPGEPPPDSKSLWRRAIVRTFPEGKLVRELPVHNTYISHLDFSPDGTRLGVNGSGDEKSELWDGTDMEIKAEGDLAKPTGIWARVWEIETGKPLFAYHEHAPVQPTESYIVPPHMRRQARDGRLVPYDGSDVVLPTPKGQTWSSDVSADGQLVAVSADSDIHVFEQLTGRPRVVFRGHTGRLAHVAFHPDNQHVASASFDDRGDYDVKIWNALRDPTGPVLRLPGQLSWPLQLVYPAPGNVLLAIEPAQKSGAYLKAFSLSTGEPAQEFETNFLGEGTLLKARVLADGDTLVAEFAPPGDKPYELRSWSLKRQELLRSIPLSEPHFSSLKNAYQEQFETAVTPEFVDETKASAQSKLVQWNMQDGQRLSSWPTGIERWVFPLAVSPNGQFVACGGYFDQGQDQVLLLYDTAQGKLLYQWTHAGIIGPSIQFTPDNARVIAASAAGWRIWDVATGELIRTMRIANTREGESRRDGPQAMAVLSRDGTRLVTTNSTHSVGGTRILVWDVAAGQQLLNMPAPFEIFELQFTPDGHRLLLLGYEDSQYFLRIWDGSP